MEVDGAQEWPEWAMGAGEAEQRPLGRAGPERAGRGRSLPGAQGEANWTLRRPRKGPCHQSCPSLRSQAQPMPQPGERMGGGGKGKEFWRIWASTSGHQEEVKKKEKKAHLSSPWLPRLPDTRLLLLLFHLRLLLMLLPTLDVLPLQPPKASSIPPPGSLPQLTLALLPACCASLRQPLLFSGLCLPV